MPDYILAKLASMIGGFFGGAAILTFIRPKTIGEAFVRGGVSVGSAIIFAGPSLKWMDLSPNWETELMAGFVVGFIAYGILGMIANTFIKNQNKDLIDVVKDIKK
jgi:NhaP-type Na+/H+ or K+/H+ antiporter